jgi:hypothetical protein
VSDGLALNIIVKDVRNEPPNIYTRSIRCIETNIQDHIKTLDKNICWPSSSESYIPALPQLLVTPATLGSPYIPAATFPWVYPYVIMLQQLVLNSIVPYTTQSPDVTRLVQIFDTYLTNDIVGFLANYCGVSQVMSPSSWVTSDIRVYKH